MAEIHTKGRSAIGPLRSEEGAAVLSIAVQILLIAEPEIQKRKFEYRAEFEARAFNFKKPLFPLQLKSLLDHCVHQSA